jgi:hypothetical protein
LRGPCGKLDTLQLIAALLLEFQARYPELQPPPHSAVAAYIRASGIEWVRLQVVICNLPLQFKDLL